jgi:gas vesicle protein
MSRDDASGTVFPFVLGLAIGAVVTLFFTPKAGEDVRSDLAEVLSGAAKQESQLESCLRTIAISSDAQYDKY